MCALCCHCLCYHHIPTFQSLHLVPRQYQGRTYLPLCYFPSRLHLLHYPCFDLLYFPLPPHLHLVLWSESWFFTVLSAFLIFLFKDWCGVIDSGFSFVSVSVWLVYLLHDGVNFCWFCFPGWLLLKILGTIHFNVAVDVGSFVRLIIEAFRWRFGHSDDFFV